MKGEDALKEETKETTETTILRKRKSQILSKLHTYENIKTIKTSKKPLRKVWIIIIIFVIIALIGGYNLGGIIPGYEPSWAYLNFDIEKFGEVQTIEEDFPQGYTTDNLNFPLNE